MRWDYQALKAGAMVSLVFAVPLSIGATWAAGSGDNSTLAVWLAVGAVCGFVLGGGCAAFAQRLDLPLSHGLATAIVSYTVAQAIFISLRLLRGADVNWFAALFNLSVVAGAGLVGGVLGGRLRAKGFRPS
ncbi:MAG TPA: hypothetical protein VMM60_01630 [Ilumatobacter sp.]|nr:hypothetical protein [Ilumatobacter sp.]